MTMTHYTHQSLIGAVIGSHSIDSLIGQGRLTVVYRGKHLRTGYPVAIKVLPLEHVPDVAAFAVEMKKLAALNHPYIVPLYEWGTLENYFYLVTRFARGGTLAQLFEADFFADPEARYERIIRAAVQMASAVDYAHDAGLLHTDLTPNNILLDKHHQLYVTDWMLPAPDFYAFYRAPEQWQAQPLSWATDIYALGVILYRMFTGDIPFKAIQPEKLRQQHIEIPLFIRNDTLPTESPEIAHLLQKALEKSPAERFATAGLLVQQLHQILMDSGKLPAEKMFPADKAMLSIRLHNETTLDVHRGKIVSLVQEKSASRNVLFAAAENGGIKQLARENEWVILPEFFRVDVPATVMTAGNRYIFVGDIAGQIHCYSRETGRTRWVTSGHRDRITCLVTGEDDMLISGSADGILSLWNVMNGARLNAITTADSVLCGTAYNRQVMTGNQAGEIQVWDVERGKLIRTCEKYAHAVMALSRQGEKLAAGFADGHVKIWQVTDTDRADEKNIRSFHPHHQLIQALALSPSGQYLATADAGGMVSFYNLHQQTFLYSQYLIHPATVLTWLDDRHPVLTDTKGQVRLFQLQI